MVTEDTTRRLDQNRPPNALHQPRKLWLSCLYLALILISLGLCVFVLAWRGRAVFDGWAKQAMLEYVATGMSDEEKREYLKSFAQEVPGIWNPVPEPKVGRLLQPGITKDFRGTELVSNSAGMRSSRPYRQKKPNRFRIVCLGDSFVMGTGGREEDRFGDQMEEILNERGLTVGGKQIEVYSIGLGSWSTLNEATYLSSRISEYQPDVVLALMFSNDITDTKGVSGLGHRTSRFSPEARRFGSGTCWIGWPFEFGVRKSGLLAGGLGPESTSRWQRAFAAWKRLEDLVDSVGGKLVLSSLESGGELFNELVKRNHHLAGLECPLLMTSYLNNALPHDPHPNPEGHRILALHFIHTLVDLGYLPSGQNPLPPLDPRLSTTTSHDPNDTLIRKLQRREVRKLPEAIVFNQLTEDAVLGFLGGIYATGKKAARLHSYPVASVKSAFLLKPAANANQLVLEIEVPQKPELFPFRLEMFVNGRSGAVLSLDSSDKGGHYRLVADIDEVEPIAIEVMLRTDSYWTEIVDDTMKSFRLISVHQQKADDFESGSALNPVPGTSRMNSPTVGSSIG